VAKSAWSPHRPVVVVAVQLVAVEHLVPRRFSLHASIGAGSGLAPAQHDVHGQRQGLVCSGHGHLGPSWRGCEWVLGA
jgi:hypothetical protein